MSAANQKKTKKAGRERGLPQNPSPKKGQNGVCPPSIGVIGKSALKIGQFPRQNFWMISRSPFLSRPLWSGDRKWCRQTGSRQSTPLSTIRTPYGNSVSTPEATRTWKPSRILSKREADTEFQYRPHIVDTDTIADAVFADAISETSIWFITENAPMRV